MPTYVFEAPNGDRIEREFSVNDCPREIKLRDVVYRKIITGVTAFKDSLPAYMTAQGSDSSHRQAAYLKSDKWYKERQRIDAQGGNVRFGSDIKD